MSDSRAADPADKQHSEEPSLEEPLLPAPSTKTRKGKRTSTGDPELDALLAKRVVGLPSAEARIALETIVNSLRLVNLDVGRLERKIINSTLKELSYAFRVFAPYRRDRKVSIFGSARTERSSPDYEVAREFARLIAKEGWMVITGAGPGIMEAGHEGAGSASSFGANIRLPMEAQPNEFIAEDEKLINFKYFFTRKLTFIKEADAFVLLPGGFGTMDEAFELLTLIQTGKSDLHPIVLLERPGGTYWKEFDSYVRGELLDRGFIHPEDLSLYQCVDTPEQGIREILSFYRLYHSQRIVNGKLVLRLNEELADDAVAEITEEFSEVLLGPIEKVSASKDEIRDDDFPSLPRLAVSFDWARTGMLRKLIDRLNDFG